MTDVFNIIVRYRHYKNVVIRLENSSGFRDALIYMHHNLNVRKNSSQEHPNESS